nr:hypothetical protein [Tanacetum cinerariifolium]
MPISKSNCVLGVQKSQRNPIFLVVVAILKNTNFFKAFTASSTIHAIYIQQFWDTMCFNSSTGLYSGQSDEQWFNLHKDILRDSPPSTNDNNPYVAQPSSDTVIEYVNTLRYPSTLRNVSAMPRHHVLQILLGIIHRSNIDYAERIWEEFVQSIQTFLTDRKNLTTASCGKKKTTHLLIPSIRFVGKDGRKIFGMPIPDALLTDEIKGAPYYGEYQEHVAKYQQYLDAEHGKAEERGATYGKIRKPRSPLKSVDEPSAEDVPGPARLMVIREPDSRRIQPLPDVQGKGKEKVVDEQVAHDLLTLLTLKNKSLVGQFIFQRCTPMPTEASRQAESPFVDAKLALVDSEMESKNVVPKINIGDQDEGQAGPNPRVQDEGQAGSNPGDAAKSQPQSSHVEEEPGKTNAEAEVQAMVLVFIHQDTSSVPSITTLVSKAVNEIVTDAVAWAMQAPLRACFSDLPAVDMKEILQQRMFEDKSYEAHEDHKKLYDALKKSLERDYSDQLLSDLEEARQKKRKRCDVPRTPSGSPPPHPPPPPAGASGAPGTSGASGSSQLAPPPSPLFTGTFGSAQQQADISGTQELSPTDSLIQDDSIPNEHVHLSDDEDSRNDHLPKADSRKDYVDNNWATALVSAYEIPAEKSLLAKTRNMTNFLNCKGSSPTLSISKMKAAIYPDFGLELLVMEQMWIDDVCAYDISEKYGISHWWFNRQKFYIDRHDSLSPDLQEHMIAKKDFKNLYPSDFEDLNLLLLQGHLDHLPGSDKQILSTAVKLWTRNLVIRQRVEDFQLVVFPVNNNERNIMRFNEIYKFIDGTLTRILEALAYRVKEFKIKRLNLVGFNPVVYTFRALSTLRRSSLRMASAATKPCQGDSLEVCLITCSICADQLGTLVLAGIPMVAAAG